MDSVGAWERDYRQRTAQSRAQHGMPQVGPDRELWERNFRERMERMRTAAGMTQTDLARVLREHYGLPFHQATIQRIEAGERPIRLNEAHLIAKAFNTDLDLMVSNYGDAETVRFNLGLAVEALVVRADQIGRFMQGQMDGLMFNNDQLRRAWAAYCAAQAEAGVSVDHELEDTVKRWERLYQDAVEAMVAIRKLGTIGGEFHGINR